MAQVPEGVSESTRVLWQVLSVPHPGSICSSTAFLLTRARLVADSTQHYPFIGDLAWIDGISTPVNSWDLLLVHHLHLPQELMADVTLQACKGPLCLHKVALRCYFHCRILQGLGWMKS